MKTILSDLISFAGTIGTIIQVIMDEDYIGLHVKSKKDGTVFDFYITKKEDK